MISSAIARSRKPTVAGLFYPDDPAALRDAVDAYLRAARDVSGAEGRTPKALIVPHAGYIYSGAVAASAYRWIGEAADRIERVILLGPAHRLAFEGLALSDASAFETPLGNVPIDAEAIARIEALPQVVRLPAAHAAEHSLEVHLPFLQTLLGGFALVPLVVGRATPAEVAEVLETLWGGPETLIVVSTDLSHYHDYDTAKRKDAATSTAIESLDETQISLEDACGRVPLSGLLRAARAHGLAARNVDLRNSGDVAGQKDRVVGYGAFVVG